jgi:CRP-like cAMP-binding protein
MELQYPEYARACQFLSARRLYFTEGEFASIRSLTRVVTYPRNTVLMEQGRPVEKLYFLNKGVCHLYRIHKEQKYIVGLIPTGEFMSTPLYMSNGMPSSCEIESLTEIEVLEWGMPEFKQLMKELPQANELFWSLMERVMMWVQDNQIDQLCLTAEERYQKLLDEHPEVLQQVPLKYIAAFLNIHQDSLSRIRKLTSQRL